MIIYKSETLQIEQTKFAEKMGVYKKTGLDKTKENADFLLTGVYKKFNTIKWKNGIVEKISGSKLEELKKSHSWYTDF